GRGRMALPATIVAMVVLGASASAIFWAFALDTPFSASSPLLLRWMNVDLRAALSSGVGPSDLHFAWTYGLGWIANAFPVSVLVLAGFYLATRATGAKPTREDVFVRSKLAQGSTETESSRWAGALVVVGIVQACFVAPFLPEPLARVPPC